MGDSDEAEYAWLAADALKPFEGPEQHSDNPPTDETLLKCIAAAGRALEEQIKSEEGPGAHSDSDGGWGLQAPPPAPPDTPRARGRRGGGRGRGRRGRGGRGRGRRRYTEDDTGSESEGGEAAGGGSPAQAPTPGQSVESILGWRMPLTEAQRTQEMYGVDR